MLWDINIIPNELDNGYLMLPPGVLHMSALGRFGRFTLFSPRVSHSKHLPVFCFVLCFGFGGVCCFVVFLFPVLQVFGIPNSPRSLDLDDRQGFIASSAMQQKKILQLDCPALIVPRTKRGGVSLVFFNFASLTTTVSAESCFVANLFYTAMSAQAPIPLRGVVSGSHLGAADAFADAAIAGIGGWWLSRGKDLAPENVCWFQFLLDATTLPSWFRAEKSGSLQRCIGALEALAQLVLFLLQVKEEKLDGNLGTVTLQFRQLCDNASVTASTFKMLSMKAPLSHVLFFLIAGCIGSLGYWQSLATRESKTQHQWYCIPKESQVPIHYDLRHHNLCMTWRMVH